jgi:protein phosphatase
VWRTILATFIVLALVAGGGVWWARTQYFIGVSEAGTISLFRGLPFEVAGYRLAWLDTDTGRPAEDAVDSVESDLENGIRVDGGTAAEDELSALVDPAAGNESLDPLCATAAGETETQPAASQDCRED